MGSGKETEKVIRESVSNVESPRKIRNVGHIQFNMPADIALRMSAIDNEVLGLVQTIETIAYEGESPGNLQFISSGMHGEETRNRLAIDQLDSALRREKILNGKIILIPHLNAPGFENKTRYIFPDEWEENLNTSSDGYKTGEWEEFFALPTKTAKYAWLVLKYMSDTTASHKGKYGQQYSSRLIDLHRDDAIAIPYLRIDRMYEDQSLLEELFNIYKNIPIPAILEYIEWADPGEQYSFFQALSAVATSHGILAAVIEEGRTRGDDPLAPLYLSEALQYYLAKEKYIDISDDELTKTQSFYKDFAAYGNAIEFYTHLQYSGEIYRLEPVSPEFKWAKSSGEQLDFVDVIKSAIENPAWDGIFSIQYSRQLRGSRKKPSKPVISIIFGQVYGLDKSGLYFQQSDVVGYAPDMGNDFCIISTPESFSSRTDVIYATLRRSEQGLKLVLMNEELEDEYGHTERLTVDDIRSALLVEDLVVNASVLDMTYALPDSVWNGSVDDEKNIKLTRKML